MSMGNLSVAFKTLKKMEPFPPNNMSEDHSEEVQWSSSVRQPEYVLRSEFKTASDGTNYGLFNLDPNSEQAADLGRGEYGSNQYQRKQ